MAAAERRDDVRRSSQAGASPNVPNVAVPPVSSRTSRDRRRPRARAAATRALRLGPQRASPASVSSSRRPPRTNSATPSSASSRRICSDSDGCARWSASAAALKLPCSIAARKYCSCWSVIGLSLSVLKYIKATAMTSGGLPWAHVVASRPRPQAQRPPPRARGRAAARSSRRAASPAMVVMAKLAYAAGANVVTLLAVRFTLGRRGAVDARRARAGWRGPCTRRDALVGTGVRGPRCTAPRRCSRSASLRAHRTRRSPSCCCSPTRRSSCSARSRCATSPPRAAASARSGSSMAGARARAGGWRHRAAVDPLGVALALGAAVLYAAYVLATGALGARLHALTLVGAPVQRRGARAARSRGASSGTLQLGHEPRGVGLGDRRSRSARRSWR